MTTKFCDVAIIGGGIAGINSARLLSEKGAKCVLLEKSDSLFGRLRSLKSAKFGVEIDCGQHIFSGAYESFCSLLKSLGTINKVSFQSALKADFIYDNTFIDSLNSSCIPVISSACGLMWLKKIDFQTKLSIAKASLKIKSNNFENSETALELLTELNQSESAFDSFWTPLSLAVFNSPCDMIRADIFCETIKKGFFNPIPKKNGLAFPKVLLSDLLTPFAENFTDNGNEIRLRTQVEKMIIKDGAIQSIICSSGEIISAKNFILAIPPPALETILLRSGYVKSDLLNDLRNYESASIISFYLDFDREILNRDFAGFINSDIHWIFNLKRLRDNVNRNIYALTISSAGDLFKFKAEELMKLCLTELYKYLPKSRAAKLLNWEVLKNRSATFILKPSRRYKFVDTNCEIKNMFLAGDWVNTGLPATIESACLSAVNAVKATAENAGGRF